MSLQMLLGGTRSGSYEQLKESIVRRLEVEQKAFKDKQKKKQDNLPNSLGKERGE